jgi:hypothetical protein
MGILDGSEETGDFSQWGGMQVMVLFSDSADVVKGGSRKGQKGHRSQILCRFVFLLRWIESLMDLSF